MPETNDGEQTIDLMDSLKKSLAERQGEGGEVAADLPPVEGALRITELGLRVEALERDRDERMRDRTAINGLRLAVDRLTNAIENFFGDAVAEQPPDS